MIKSKQDLADYLYADKIASGKKDKKRPRPSIDIIWKWQILLRKCEYYCNCRHDVLGKLYSKFLNFRYLRLSQKLGFSVGFNVFDKGLAVAHYGTIVVNACCRVGKNCRIHDGVTLGVSGECYWSGRVPTVAPIIGDNVFIATGAKIIGGVKIADNVAIGANAVVTKDITEPGTTWAGVPAKKISDKGSELYMNPELLKRHMI